MRYGLLDSKEPCIILATSGMMSGGPVMEYFRAWAPDEKNGILFVGYQADGTFGRRLQRGLSRGDVPGQRPRQGRSRSAWRSPRSRGSPATPTGSS